MKNTQPIVNTVILSSIKLNKKLKSYYMHKYLWLAKHNGLAYAADVFKRIREVVLAYRADSKRLSKLSWYLNQVPVRKNGWLKMLFAYADSQPEEVLNFLKLYVGLNEPLVSVEQSARTEDVYLASREESVNTDVPTFLQAWLRMITLPVLTKNQYRQLKRAGDKFPIGFKYPRKVLALLRRYASWHTYAEYTAYVKDWKYRLSLGRWKTGPNRGKAISSLVMESLRKALPVPEMYVDYDNSKREVASNSLEQDFWRWNLILQYHGGITLTPDQIMVIQMGLSPEFLSMMKHSKNSLDSFPMCPITPYDGSFVGQIHHIPKKGTVKRRPIAAPNRILQMGMAPCADFLDSIIRKFPHDCTFNQGKMDTKITNRVTNENLYVGSVDLSQATDNLPLSWGIAIWERLFRPRSSIAVNASWDLFVKVSKEMWLNDKVLSKWTVGQPLGALPSFRVLALTHNLFLEALSFEMGYGHSPYCILGDDLLVFNKKLRKRYIREMTNRGIPLSLHKSYEGNLVEFAGKTYVKNHVPFYTSDQAPIGFGNLFDYQRATGIVIPWSHLPSKVRRRFSKECEKNGLSNSFEIPSVYYLAQLGVCGKTAHPIKNDDAKLRAYFFHMADEVDTQMPDPNLQSGIVVMSGHPIVYGRVGYAEKHQYLQRYREVSLPDWYKQKFRPDTTDKIAKCATLAVIGWKDLPSIGV